MTVSSKKPLGLTVLVKGAGEMASGIAYRLARSNFNVCLTDVSEPTAVRREVAFSEAVYEGEKQIEGVTAKLVRSFDDIGAVWKENKIPLLIDPHAEVRGHLKPAVVVDAILAKKNLGTTINDAPLAIGVGPGFRAGVDVHVVIETNRGHYLGMIIETGEAEKNTGIPGEIQGLTEERVIRAPIAGIFISQRKIGEHVENNDIVARVGDVDIKVKTHGVIRGLLRNGTEVSAGMKAGDIDPRGVADYCFIISDKARTIAGGVLEAILHHYNVD